MVFDPTFYNVHLDSNTLPRPAHMLGGRLGWCGY